MTTCSACRHPVPDFERVCPACQADIGFPNVRAAETAVEKQEFLKRVADARVSTGVRKCADVLDSFGKTVGKNSKAVICRSLSLIQWLMSSDNNLYQGFYKQVGSGARLPENNEWDPGRQGVDASLFPYYFEHITFAALSLDGHGPKEFGGYTLVLRNDMVERRATVFEENSRVFCQTKHKLVLGDPIPPGYRAPWQQRGQLAIAKLHCRLLPQTKPQEFPEILMSPGGKRSQTDVIEVHIYGPIHRAAIERVAGPPPTKREDKAIWRSLEKKMKEAGVELEID